MKRDTFEIRQIDAYLDEVGSWTWNNSYTIGIFSVRDGGYEQRAFKRALTKLGIWFKPSAIQMAWDGDICEVLDRKTGEPLFAAIQTT